MGVRPFLNATCARRLRVSGSSPLLSVTCARRLRVSGSSPLLSITCARWLRVCGSSPLLSVTCCPSASASVDAAPSSISYSLFHLPCGLFPLSGLLQQPLRLHLLIITILRSGPCPCRLTRCRYHLRLATHVPVSTSTKSFQLGGVQLCAVLNTRTTDLVYLSFVTCCSPGLQRVLLNSKRCFHFINTH